MKRKSVINRQHGLYLSLFLFLLISCKPNKEQCLSFEELIIDLSRDKFFQKKGHISSRIIQYSLYVEDTAETPAPPPDSSISIESLRHFFGNSNWVNDSLYLYAQIINSNVCEIRKSTLKFFPSGDNYSLQFYTPLYNSNKNRCYLKCAVFTPKPYEFMEIHFYLIKKDKTWIVSERKEDIFES